LTSSRSEATRSFSFFDSQHALTQITVWYLSASHRAEYRRREKDVKVGIEFRMPTCRISKVHSSRRPRGEDAPARDSIGEVTNIL